MLEMVNNENVGERLGKWKYEQELVLSPPAATTPSMSFSPPISPTQPPFSSYSFTPPPTEASPPFVQSALAAHSSRSDNPRAEAPKPASDAVHGASAVGFRTRRRRVAKLSKFFGVGYHDLVDTMAHGYAVDRPAGTAAGPTGPRLRDAQVRAAAPETDVRLDSGPGFWGDAPARPGDMIEAIGKLRELKAGF